MARLLEWAAWCQAHTYVLFLWIGAVVMIAWAGSLLRRRKETHATTHGSARYALMREVQQAGLCSQRGIVLGKLHGQTLRSDKLHVLMCGPSGCHAPGTDILMANGTIKPIEDISIGDEVMGPDSLPRNILRLYHGHGEMVRIVPVKGQPFIVTHNHILSLKRIDSGTSLPGTIQDISVEDWLRQSKTFRNVHTLFRTGVEFLPGKPLLVHPYILGVLLGDGCPGKNDGEIINNDPEVKEAVKTFLRGTGILIPYSYDQAHHGAHHFFLRSPMALCHFSKEKNRLVRHNPLDTKLRTLKVFGWKAADKFVPECYKISSKENRLWMLAGLLDTDGSYDRGGYDYISQSAQLAADVAFIARSVGLAAYVSPCQKRWQNGGGTSFRVSISGHLDSVPCQIPRKQATPRQQMKSVLHTGFTVQPLGIGEYYGFQCAGDGRYVMGDFTVTHNSGKDSTVCIPTTLTWRESMLIVDVKDGGENYAICHKVRERIGPVYRFAPGVTGSHRYNFLSTIRVGTPHEFRDATMLMHSLLAPLKKDTRSTDSGSFFERQGVVAGRAILLYTLYTAPPGKATLQMAHTHMHDAEAMCTAMSTHPHPEIQGQGTRLLALMHKSDRQFAGEWSATQSVLDLFSDPIIAAATETSDFRLMDLQYGKQPMTLYLGAESPTNLLYLHPLFRVLIHMAYHQLTSIQNAKRRAQLLMLLNEFPELGFMDILERAPAYARSYGIRFLLVIQDLGQLFNTYGYATPLWGNMATKIFHGPNHDETAVRLSRMLGPTTIETTSTHTNRGRMGRSVTTAQAARPLMTEAEVLGLPPGEELLWIEGMEHPVRAKKIRYWSESW